MLICRWDGTAADRIHVTHVGSRERYSFQEHSHGDYMELVYVRHGILEHEIEGAWQRQSAGTATLLRSGERHALRGERVEYINVSFDSRFLKRLDPDLKAALATPGPMVVHLPAARRTLFEADAESLVAATNPALRAVLLMQALCAVAATRLAHVHQQPQCGPPWLARLHACTLARAT